MSQTPDQAPPALWCGWARAGGRGRWRCLIRAAASEHACLEQLRTQTAASRHVDLFVGTADKDPNEVATPRAGRLL